MNEIATPSTEDDSIAADATPDTSRLAEAVADIALIVPMAPQGLLEPRLRTPFFTGFVALALAVHAAGLCAHLIGWWSEGAGGRFSDATGIAIIDTEIIDARDMPDIGGRIEEATPGNPSPAAVASVEQAASAAQMSAPEATTPPAPREAAAPRVEALTTASPAEVSVAVAIPEPPFKIDTAVPPQIETAQQSPTVEPQPQMNTEAVPTEATPQQEAMVGSQPGDGGMAQSMTEVHGNGGIPAASPGQVRTYQSRLGAHIRANRPISRGRTGKVVVTFGIEPDGGLKFANVVQSSGNQQLEAKTLAAMHKASPFPKPPPGMTAKQLEFTVPFSFHQ